MGISPKGTPAFNTTLISPASAAASTVRPADDLAISARTPAVLKKLMPYCVLLRDVLFIREKY
jgi:hypothetical protein